MRTTVNIDDEVLAAAKAKSRFSGLALGKVLSDWARVGMGRRAAVRSKAVGGKQLPTFKVSRNAPTIPAERAAELLDEEG